MFRADQRLRKLGPYVEGHSALTGSQLSRLGGLFSWQIMHPVGGRKRVVWGVDQFVVGTIASLYA